MVSEGPGAEGLKRGAAELQVAERQAGLDWIGSAKMFGADCRSDPGWFVAGHEARRRPSSNQGEDEMRFMVMHKMTDEMEKGVPASSGGDGRGGQAHRGELEDQHLPFRRLKPSAHRPRQDTWFLGLVSFFFSWFTLHDETPDMQVARQMEARHECLRRSRAPALPLLRKLPAMRSAPALVYAGAGWRRS
jgi:hypothetical protein